MSDFDYEHVEELKIMLTTLLDASRPEHQANIQRKGPISTKRI